MFFKTKKFYTLLLVLCIFLSIMQAAFAAVHTGIAAPPAHADTKEAPAAVFSIGDSSTDTLAEALAILKTKTSAANPALIEESILVHADYTISSQADADALESLRGQAFALSETGARVHRLLALQDGVTLTITSDIQLESIQNVQYLIGAESEEANASLVINRAELNLSRCKVDTMLWNLDIQMQPRSYLIVEENEGTGIYGDLTAESSYIYLNYHKNGHGFIGSLSLTNASMESANNDYAGVVSTAFSLNDSEIRISDNATADYTTPYTLLSDFTFDTTQEGDFTLTRSKIVAQSFTTRAQTAASSKASIAIYAGTDGVNAISGDRVNLYVKDSSFIVGSETIIHTDDVGDAKISVDDTGEPEGSLGDGIWKASQTSASLTTGGADYAVYADDIVSSRDDLLYSAVYLPISSMNADSKLMFGEENVSLEAALAENAVFPITEKLADGRMLRLYASAAYVVSIEGNASLTLSGKEDKKADTVKTGTSWVVRDPDEATVMTVQPGADSYLIGAVMDGASLPDTPATPNSALHFIYITAAEIEAPAKSSANTLLTLGDTAYQIYADDFWNGAHHTYLIYLPTASMQDDETDKTLTLTPSGGKTYTLDLSALPTDTTTPVRLTDADGTVFELYASAAYAVKISGLGTGSFVSIGSDVISTNIASGWVVRDSDENTVITASPSENQQLSGFILNGVGQTPPYTMSANTALHTLEITFADSSTGSAGSSKSSAAITYMVEATADAGGSVSPIKSQVPRGGSLTVSITPDAGYAVSGLTVNGVSIAPVSSYTFSDIRANQTLHAAFEPLFIEEPTRFADVHKADWFYNAVEYVSEDELFNGMSSTSFGPGVNMTREMFVTVLGRLAESLDISTAGYSANFSDVPAGAYYTGYVAWANANNIVTGYDAVTFGTGDYITREQMAALLIRFAEYAELSLQIGSPTSFVDSSRISTWASDAVAVASSTKLINGYTDGTFLPKNTATRAEVATIFMNLSTQLNK